MKILTRGFWTIAHLNDQKRGTFCAAQTFYPFWTILDCQMTRYFPHFKGGDVIFSSFKASLT